MPRLHPRIMSEKEELEKKLKATEAELSTTKMMCNNLLAVGGGKKRKSDDLNKEFTSLIGHLIKEEVFKICKFITGQKQENNFILHVIEALNKEEFDGDTEEAAKEKTEFQIDYGGFCVKVLNDHRNYVQSRLKNGAWQWMDENLGQLPPFRDMLLCAQRKLEVNDANADSILYYVDHMMPLMSGIASDFSIKLRYYHTISHCKSRTDSCLIDITPQTEAFGLIVMENTKDKWPKLYELEATIVDKDKKRIQVLKEKKILMQRERTLQSFFYITDYPELDTKYTESNVGQQECGGWSNDGVLRYVKFKDVITYARTTDYGIKWENDVKELLRKKHNVTQPTFELQRKHEGKSTGGKPKEPVKEVAELDLEYDKEKAKALVLEEV